VRTVQVRVDASREIVDDACAFAWIQFMQWQPDRERNWRGWLITTAEREAWRLRHEEARNTHLELPHGDDLELEPPDPRDRLELRANLRHALDLLSAVPERRRQAKALHVMGYSYEEIREALGISHTRVHQLIAEANAAMRREQLRIGPDQPRSPRAARLRELEEQPPRWLCASIGRPPVKSQRAEAVLAWRRAALAVDDYRREYAPGVDHDPLRDRPTDSRAGPRAPARLPSGWASSGRT
jgi:RNA polymerase sigma factor (sigma-70 family)